MMKSFLEFIVAIVTVWAVVALIAYVTILPMMYLDGSAKSRWLKDTEGVEMPWYEATHLTVRIGDDCKCGRCCEAVE